LVYFLYTLFFVSCLVLIASVLLQPGKTDAGALFTSNISSTAFQPRGATTILSKLTIMAASVFMLSALLLAMPALTGNVSVLQTTGETPAEATPALDANVNSNADANVDVNANTAANANVDVNANATTNTNVASNANAAANTSTNTNARSKTTERKPVERVPSNK
jgi:preprotein translocase subunit SecG